MSKHQSVVGDFGTILVNNLTMSDIKKWGAEEEIQRRVNRLLTLYASHTPFQELLTDSDPHVRRFVQGILKIAETLQMDSPSDFASFIEEATKRYPSATFNPETSVLTTATQTQMACVSPDGVGYGNLGAISKVKLQK